MAAAGPTVSHYKYLIGVCVWEVYISWVDATHRHSGCHALIYTYSIASVANTKTDREWKKTKNHSTKGFPPAIHNNTESYPPRITFNHTNVKSNISSRRLLNNTARKHHNSTSETTIVIFHSSNPIEHFSAQSFHIYGNVFFPHPLCVFIVASAQAEQEL